ncbi:MAG: hypothetical protein ACFE9L_20805 [Candidatus Hodarchaeota archaeon]
MEIKEEQQEFISTLEDEIFWISFALIKKELRNRDLVRKKHCWREEREEAFKVHIDTSNLPKLIATPEGIRNIEALSRNGEYYSIKTITYPTTKKMGVFIALILQIQILKMIEYLNT